MSNQGNISNKIDGNQRIKKMLDENPELRPAVAEAKRLGDISNKIDDLMTDLLWQCSECIDEKEMTLIKSLPNYKDVLQSFLSLLEESNQEARLDELAKTNEYIDNTYMFITNDLPALLEQDRVFEIRKQHKDEIHKNISDRIKELTEASKETV